MAKYYPHKQTILIAAVCILAVGGTAFYTYEKPAPVLQQAVSVDTKLQNENTIISTSTDWKKQFFASNGLTAALASTSIPAPNASDKPITATDVLSRDVFTQLINLKQTNLLNNSAVVSSTISDILAQNSVPEKTPRVYSIKDISINSDTSIDALTQYGNEVGTLLKTDTPKQDSTAIALAGVQGKDDSFEQELQANTNLYGKILDGLLAIPAPQSVASYHLNLINAASQFKTLSFLLMSAKADPMAAVQGLGMYKAAYELALGNLINIRNALHAAGITYQLSDGGSFFFTTTSKVNTK